jgi:16S rRNA (guanine527-N7)-methyltransferase
LPANGKSVKDQNARGLQLNEKNEKFQIYKNLLIEWNKKFNLTTITSKEQIYKKHFEDSLTALRFIENTDKTIIDVGTGAGFPGVPILIERPDLKLTLLEARRKKTEFLKALAGALDFPDIDIIWGRAEEQKNLFNKFDVCVARAVANLKDLVKICVPFVRLGGKFIALKGAKTEEEIKEAAPVIAKLRCKISAAEKIFISDDASEHTLILIEKNT